MSNYGSNVVVLNGLTASAALNQYGVVKHASTAGEVIAVAATTDFAIGIVQNDPAAGEPALVAALGEAIAIAGTSNLAVGELVGFAYNSTANLGRVVDHTTDNRRIIGVAMEASTAIGDEVRVLLTGLSRY